MKVHKAVRCSIRFLLSLCMISSFICTAFALDGQSLSQPDAGDGWTVTAQNGSTGARFTITDSQEVQQVLDALNGFQYTSMQEVSTGGWYYGILLQSGEEAIRLTVQNNSIKTGGTLYVNEETEPLSELTALLDEVFTRHPDFSDVSSGAWYFPAVMACANRGIVSGDGNGHFHPLQAVTRAEAAKMLTLARGDEAGREDAAESFPDTAGHLLRAYIAAAVENGLMQGKGNGTFDPDGSLTRGELAVLVCRAMNLTSRDGAVVFSDVAENAWYRPYIEMASAAGYLSGSGGAFRPGDVVTRAEFAQAIENLYNQET